MLRKIVLAVRLCAAVSLVLLLFGPKIAFAEEEKLPEERSGEYSFYLSEERPYIRLSPHRSETVDADGKTQPRRISALYSLADLRLFGGQKWDAKQSGSSPAYSLTPQVSAPSGTRYAMVSPEQTELDAGLAARLRAVVAVSYPFCTAEKMRSFLTANGVLTEQNGIISAPENFTAGNVSESISESELLSAVQTAIWRIAGKQGSITKVYTDTRAVGRTARTLEPDPYDGADTAFAHTANNIRAVSDWLCSLSESTAADMPLTAMTVSAILEENTNHITLRVRPNGTVNADDSLVLEIGETSYALGSDNGSLPLLQPDTDGVYTVRLEEKASASKSITIQLSGTQHTAKDVCLYRPSSGDVMQSLIGAFGGTVEVSLKDTLKTENLTDRARLRCMTELLADGPKIPLAGVTFSLYLSDASQGMTCVAENLMTDHEGLIDVQHLRQPKKGERYLFVPTAVPQGYAVPVDARIETDSAAAVQAMIPPAYTASAMLSLTDDNGTGIAEIPFALYRVFDSTETVLLSEYQTDASGNVSIFGLPAGEYRFQQLAVPEGFAAETENYSFATERGGETRIAAKNLAYRSVEGQVRFDGCDPPASVRVLLLRDGAVFAEQAVSEDSDWRFSFPDIPVMGMYTLSQVPIAGYVSEIDDALITNRPRTCDVTLRQMVDGQVSLSGAVFSLQRTSDGAHICTTASKTDGKITFSSLPMGSYLLRERRTPVGVRTMKEALYLVIADPNIATDGDLPLTAALQDAEGNVFEGLTIERKRKIFFGLGLHGMLSAIGLVLVFFALLIRKCIGRAEAEPCLYSGKTKLYPISKKKTVLHRLRFLSFRKHGSAR